MRLKEKVAVVTGSGSGIGRATALLFAEEGAQVVVVDQSEADGQETVTRIAQMNGPRALAIKADVTQESDLALTRSMACDHAEANIRVNAILPGPTFTDFHVKRAQAAGRTLDEGVTERNPQGPAF